MGNIATTYEVIWGPGPDGSVELESEKQARDKARRKSGVVDGEVHEVTILKFVRGEVAGALVYRAGRVARNLEGEEARTLGASLAGEDQQGGEDSEKVEEAAPEPPMRSQEGNPTIEGLHEEFHSREGTNKAKLLERLGSSFGNPVTVGELILAVYGVKRNADQRIAALRMVMKGLYHAIETRGLPYNITPSREDGHPSYTLERTK